MTPGRKRPVKLPRDKLCRARQLAEQQRQHILGFTVLWVLTTAACGHPAAPTVPATVLLMNGSASIRWDVSALAGPSDPGTGLGALSPKSQRCVTLPVAPTLRLYFSAGGPLHATTFPFRPADSPGWISSIGDIVLDPMDAPSPWPVCTS